MATAPKQLSDPQAEKLRQIHTIPALVKYLDEELGWPVGVEDWEDAVFDWQPEELNLKAEHQVAIKSIKQLRPLVTGQPWGIFFVDFDKGQLPIVVLRRVLNGLAVKRRVTGSGHQTWLARDLLFISSFGETSSREIALAHFTDESEMGDLPTLRVLGWDEADTALELSYVAKTLKEKLRWPARTASKVDQDAWRIQWASAFSLKYRQVINDSKTLALGLAELAKRIRGRVNTVLALESENGHLRQLHKAFKDNLIADLSEDAFADMFAQTITYGLFTARASCSSSALVADNLSDMVPSTNPFLKELLADFLSAAGRDRHKKKRVDFDELGINEVVTTLRDVPMDAVLRAFNKEKPGDDPVIHFYEDFLKAYDKKMRAKRGVFYTPGPVVHFIVKSVDEILKTEFGIEDGLASTITWGEMMAAKPELKLPKFCTLDTPFVQVLDPATGTGTFIVEVITQVHAHMLGKWAKQGKVTKPQWQPLWIEYVKTHLLPRLYAFELMMAPYAIAHMKIGLKLAETGYTFPEGGPRVNVFLTNALEPAHPVQPQLEELAPMLAHEARAANVAKETLTPTVVVGNPPYSVSSQNKGAWIYDLCDVFKRGLEGEKNIQPLSDDYVKFFRLCTWYLERSAKGVVGVITNREFLRGVLHRGMRKSLLTDFESIQCTDLHGQRGELFDPPATDENVFEIEKGVAITHLTKGAAVQRREFRELIGTGQWKLGRLAASTLSTLTPRHIEASTPDCVFLPSAQGEVDPEYDLMTPVTAFFSSLPVTGFATHRDSFAIDFDDHQLRSRLNDFLSDELSDDFIRQKYQLGDTRDWKLGDARVAAKKHRTDHPVRLCLYRPFDCRWIVYSDDVLEYARRTTMQDISRGNLALIASRIVKDEAYAHCFVSPFPVEKIFLSPKSSNNAQVLVCHNLRPPTVFGIDAEGHSKSENRADWFHYIYAILNCPSYRKRFATRLATAFPRIPIPRSRAVFDALAALGARLVAWHLLEHPDATTIGAVHARHPGTTAWFGTDFSLQKVAEKGRELAEASPSTGSGRAASGEAQTELVGKVFINASSGFANVRLPVWQHTIGGYQVLHKWLDDRRKAGRSLSQDDITHWLRVYAALEATQALMLQVDDAIEAHGGWPGAGSDLNAPGAFSQNHPPPDAATLALEQMAQKEQIKAQRKVATATKKRATSVSPTGASSLFDFDDDLDALAAASGASPRPKSRATPAKAAGGVDEVTDWQAMCAIRVVLAHADASALTRPELIRHTARELGHVRTSPRIAKELDAAIRRAVRRGIASNARGELSLVAKTIDGYDRDFLKQYLLSVITSTWMNKAEVAKRFARGLGFSRVGPVIGATVESLVRATVRSGDVERNKLILRRVRGRD